MLNDNEKALPRRIRRALLSNRRGTIQKRTPFGRVRVEGFDTGYEPQDDRTMYLHFTKGRMDRRTTIPLLDNLITVG